MDFRVVHIEETDSTNRWLKHCWQGLWHECLGE